MRPLRAMRFGCSRDAGMNAFACRHFQHYRAMGVDRFYIVDNESTDGTTDYLTTQPDLHLFRTKDSYSGSGSGTAWMNTLLAEFGVGCWCVTVDIGFLIFPGSEQVSLRTLTAHLDERGHDAFARACCSICILRGRSSTAGSAAGDDLIAAAPYFDTGPYRPDAAECPGYLIMGGVRERIFTLNTEAAAFGRRRITPCSIACCSARHLSGTTHGCVGAACRARPPFRRCRWSGGMPRPDTSGACTPSLPRPSRPRPESSCTSSCCTTCMPRRATRPHAASIHEARWSTGDMREPWIGIRRRRSCTKIGALRGHESTRAAGPHAGQRGLD